jgi:hypothetical protein
MNCFKTAAVVLVVASHAFAQSGSTNQPQGQGQMQGQKPAGQTAQTPPAGQMPDMSKMGPWSRKPTDEGKTKKDIQAFLKSSEETMKKGDFNAALAEIDFPVYMATDDSKGMTKAKEYSREQYTAMMKPMYENMPKDHQASHKHNITVLSDNLAMVVDDYTMSHNKQKFTGKSACLLVKKDNQWKYKTMTEAGWGDMSGPGTGGSPQTEHSHTR